MIAPDRVAIRKADLESAIAAGVIDASAADRLVAFVQKAGASQADEENLRLISSFNDIFVIIGLALFLGALFAITRTYSDGAGALFVAAASWLLAEVFTRRKRMALPSIVLLITFSAGVLAGVVGGIAPYVDARFGGWNENALAIAGIVTTILIGFHWWRFRVPITVAAGCGSLVVAVLSVILPNAPAWIESHPILVFLPLGLAVFALAMAFDMTDRQRLTRRTDIAFWLHVLAAPMIVHPIVAQWSPFYHPAAGDPVVIMALFAGLSIVALVIDRRALLVSSLSYLGYATYTLVPGIALTSYGAAPAVLAVGSIVLILSIAWRPLRRLVLHVTPPPIRMLVPEAA